MSGIIDPGSTSPTNPIKPVEPSPITQPQGGGVQEFKGPEERMKGLQGPETEKPSPMEIMEQMGHDRKPATPESVGDQLTKLQDTFQGAKNQLQNPGVAKSLRPDHDEALSKLVGKLNGDMGRIAKNSDTEFAPKTRATGETIVDYVSSWIDGSQETLAKALQSVSQVKDPDPARLMNLQYSVQRATQRAELFSTIIGSSVSGIKTIMSTQLG